MKMYTVLYRSGDTCILGDEKGGAFACTLREPNRVDADEVDVPVKVPHYPTIGTIGGVEVKAVPPVAPIEFASVRLEPLAIAELPGVSVKAAFEPETGVWFVRDG
jgi:hypothetical protein